MPGFLEPTLQPGRCLGDRKSNPKDKQFSSVKWYKATTATKTEKSLWHLNFIWQHLEGIWLGNRSQNLSSLLILQCIGRWPQEWAVYNFAWVFSPKAPCTNINMVEGAIIWANSAEGEETRGVRLWPGCWVVTPVRDTGALDHSYYWNIYIQLITLLGRPLLHLPVHGEYALD